MPFYAHLLACLWSALGDLSIATAAYGLTAIVFWRPRWPFDKRWCGPALMWIVCGVAAVLLSGGDVSLGSMVGFVTVFGIAIRNGILLISHYQHLQYQEQMPFDRELILRGAAERLAPILMTASSTALALLPLVVLGNLPGHEIEHPMAVVIIGGLVSSTFLTLFLLPVLYELLGGRLVQG